jgi:hypothetical protein
LFTNTFTGVCSSFPCPWGWQYHGSVP